MYLGEVAFQEKIERERKSTPSFSDVLPVAFQEKIESEQSRD